jgi:hypothetical protein
MRLVRKAIFSLIFLALVGTAFAGVQSPPYVWPTNLIHARTIASGATEILQPSIVTTEIFTFSATAAVTIPQANFTGQVLNAIVCQNGTGGFTPTFTPIAGLTIVGTFPTFTTTASKCGDFSLTYDSITHAYLTGSAAGPL